MAYDLKYGVVNLERGDIKEDEPIFVFRAQDRLLPRVLAYYLSLCLEEGSPEVHLINIAKNYDLIIRWQHSNETKTPESAAGSV